jgi:hypothetical protein
MTAARDPGSEVVVDLADARTWRSIRRSIALAAASGNTTVVRERRIRAAAFSFARNGALERHAQLAAYDDSCPADTDERDAVTVARIVLGLSRGTAPTLSDFLAVFGVDAPSPSDVARFVVETAGDMYCRLHGVRCED